MLYWLLNIDFLCSSGFDLCDGDSATLEEAVAGQGVLEHIDLAGPVKHTGEVTNQLIQDPRIILRILKDNNYVSFQN